MTVMHSDGSLLTQLIIEKDKNSGYNELFDSQGNVREAYQAIYESLNSLDSADFHHRHKELQDIITENGVSYNIYDKNDSSSYRNWMVDLFPLAFTSKEWQNLEKGLIQRAELLELIFNDIYGKQSLLENKIIPPKLIYSHAGFLRQCLNIHSDESHNLILHSTDLVRAADGEFYAYGDRIQAPSGAGYALENRLAVSKLYPSLFRNTQVHRLITYFRSLRHILAKRARELNGNSQSEPNIVFFTPGPGSETYFEHTFLSTYLGYELVQGEDLLVMNSKVYMRTLDGLKKVDVIIKRVDDFYCDPLEFKGDSLLGVAGLMQAVRNKNVILANPIGAGVLENTGLLPYLNSACKFFLGEELRIKNIESFWMGDASSKDQVFSDFHNFCILPTYLHSVTQILYPQNMSTAEQNRLKVKINEKPESFAAQRILPSNNCPVYQGNKFENGRYVLRTYAVANEQSYLIMPGALARVTTMQKELTIMNQKGAISKDVWVISSEPEVDSLHLPVEEQSGSVEQKGISIEKTDKVPSRIAENLFWLGRYIERAENSARILRKTRELISDTSSSEYSGAWLNMVTDATYSHPGFYGINKNDFSQIENEITNLIFNNSNIGSLGFNFNNIIFTARNAFDRLSEDSVRIINKLEIKSQYNYQGDTGDYLDESLQLLAALSNNFSESMNQNAGWVLLQIGRRLERALFFIHLIRSFNMLQPQIQNALLEHLLEVNNARNTYKRRYRHSVNLETVIDLLVFDEKNPRSLAYQLIQLNYMVNKLNGPTAAKKTEIEKLLLKIISLYQLQQTKDEYQKGYPTLGQLSGWMQETFNDLSKINGLLQQQFFVHPETQSQVQSYTEENDD